MPPPKTRYDAVERPCSRNGFTMTDHIFDPKPQPCASAVALALAEVRQARRALDAAELALLSVHSGSIACVGYPPYPADPDHTASMDVGFDHSLDAAHPPTHPDEEDDESADDPWRRPSTFYLQNHASGQLSLDSAPGPENTSLRPRVSLRDMLHGTDSPSQTSLLLGSRDSLLSSSNGGGSTDSIHSISMTHSPRPPRMSQLEQIVEEEPLAEGEIASNAGDPSSQTCFNSSSNRGSTRSSGLSETLASFSQETRSSSLEEEPQFIATGSSGRSHPINETSVESLVLAENAEHSSDISARNSRRFSHCDGLFLDIEPSIVPSDNRIHYTRSSEEVAERRLVHRPSDSQLEARLSASSAHLRSITMTDSTDAPTDNGLIAPGDWSADSKVFMHPRQAPQPPPSPLATELKKNTGGSSLEGGRSALRHLSRGHLRTTSDLAVGRKTSGSAASSDNHRVFNLVGNKLKLGRLSAVSAPATGAQFEPSHRRSKTFGGVLSEITQPQSSTEAASSPKSLQKQLPPQPPPRRDSQLIPELTRTPADQTGSSSAGGTIHHPAVAEARAHKHIPLASRLFAWKTKSKSSDSMDAGTAREQAAKSSATTSAKAGESSTFSFSSTAAATRRIVSGITSHTLDRGSAVEPARRLPGRKRANSTSSIGAPSLSLHLDVLSIKPAGGKSNAVEDSAKLRRSGSLHDTNLVGGLSSVLRPGGPTTLRLQRSRSHGASSALKSSATATIASGERVSRHSRAATRARSPVRDPLFLAIPEGSPDVPRSVSGSERSSSITLSRVVV